jgi:hypothetical protein
VIVSRRDLFLMSPQCVTNEGLILWLRSANVPYLQNGAGDVQVLAKDAHRLESIDDNITPMLKGQQTFTRDEPGVYLLKWKGEVVYVGMTKSLFTRMEKHIRGDYKFDEITFIRTSQKDAGLLESELIGRYLPKYNQSKNPQKTFPQKRRVLAESGVSG